ncbi:Protein TRM32 [Senna tora]|uniref:Protein TRM32 n=1 Tax=Senna tora TaxID=362788 RepID=A0A834SN33_9FABA|nr:Protein TRM32 [Senna tora]
MDEHLQEEKTADSHHEVVRSEEDFLKFGILNRRLNLDIPGLEVDASIEGEFNYVRDVLELSGFMGHDSPAMWYSNDQPVDPIVYEELEGCLLFDPECSDNVNQENDNCNHLLLFDLVNEVLVEIFGRSYSYYPKPLSSLSHVHPLPVGDHVLRQVWTLISWYLSSNNAELFYPSLDYYVSRDLARSDGWMNLQFDSECVGLELDDLIFDDLLEEIICS